MPIMLGRDYSDQVCSISRALEVVGERWTLLVLRDVLLGRHRFDEFVESLGVTRTVLTQRLRLLVDEGVLEHTAYQQRPERFVYEATAPGRELAGALRLLAVWGANRRGEAGTSRHGACGSPLEARLWCPGCELAVNEDEAEELDFA